MDKQLVHLCQVFQSRRAVGNSQRNRHPLIWTSIDSQINWKQGFYTSSDGLSGRTHLLAHRLGHQRWLWILSGIVLRRILASGRPVLTTGRPVLATRRRIPIRRSHSGQPENLNSDIHWYVLRCKTNIAGCSRLRLTSDRLVRRWVWIRIRHLKMTNCRDVCVSDDEFGGNQFVKCLVNKIGHNLPQGGQQSAHNQTNKL